jgi:hypothetical protein
MKSPDKIEGQRLAIGQGLLAELQRARVVEDFKPRISRVVFRSRLARLKSIEKKLLWTRVRPFEA